MPPVYWDPNDAPAPGPAVPPLRREALEYFPVAYARLCAFWQAMGPLVTLMQETLPGVDPDALPGPLLALWVDAHMTELHQLFSNALDLYALLRRLQVMPDYVLDNWLEYYEDEVVPTD